MLELLKERLPALNEKQLALMRQYYERMLAGNSRMNLTAVTEPEEAVDKHFVDSLLAEPFIKKQASCIDVGTGAGFPGIPLLIARGDIQMTLLDSLQKRVRFLEETCAALCLKACFVHARAEDAGRDSAHRGRYDVALSRAVAPLNVLLELTVPFVRVGGIALAYKGKAAQEEAKSAASAAIRLGCTLHVLPLQADYGERALICATKNAATPMAYPRRAGEPSRNPL